MGPESVSLILPCPVHLDLLPWSVSSISLAALAALLEVLRLDLKVRRLLQLQLISPRLALHLLHLLQQSQLIAWSKTSTWHLRLRVVGLVVGGEVG